MTPEQQERMLELCKKIQDEHDPTTFTTTPSKKSEHLK